MATMIRLENPLIELTDGVTTYTVSDMTNSLNFGAEVDDESASFDNPNGVGEAFIEITAGASVDVFNMMLDNVNTYVDATVVPDKGVAYPSATNWTWAGKVWVPVLTEVLNASIRGYTRTTVRFESRGQAWTVDKGAGPVAVDGWR